MSAWYHRVFPTSDALSNSDVETGLRRIVQDGMASQAMASLTGSAFLTAFAVSLGASNVTIGILAAIPHLAQLCQLPSITLVNRIGNRRFLSVISSTLGRSSWLLVAAAPLFLDQDAALLMLVFGLGLASIMAAVSNAGWNSWIHELVPADRLGSFFGRRFGYATAIGMTMSLLGAYFVDAIAPAYLPDQRYAYSVLFTVAFILGVVGVLFVARIPEPTYQRLPGTLWQLLKQPFKDANFVNLIRFIGSWNLAMYLATPFFVVYMLTRLELRLGWVVALIVLGRLINILFLRVWGAFSDRRGNKAVLALSCPLCLLCVFGWTFTSLPEKYFLTIPLLIALHVFMGIAMAGITLATGNIGLHLAPQGSGTSFLASLNFVSAMAAGVAPLLAGGLVDFFINRELSWTLRWSDPGSRSVSLEILNLQQWDFIFVLSAVAGLYALHRLALVRDIDNRQDRIELMELLNAAGRELRDFSPVATIRNIRTFSFSPARNRQQS